MLAMQVGVLAVRPFSGTVEVRVLVGREEEGDGDGGTGEIMG